LIVILINWAFLAIRIIAGQALIINYNSKTKITLHSILSKIIVRAIIARFTWLTRFNIKVIKFVFIKAAASYFLDTVIVFTYLAGIIYIAGFTFLSYRIECSITISTFNTVIRKCTNITTCDACFALTIIIKIKLIYAINTFTKFTRRA
jgi:hypothetical protein